MKYLISYDLIGTDAHRPKVEAKLKDMGAVKILYS